MLQIKISAQALIAQSLIASSNSTYAALCFTTSHLMLSCAAEICNELQCQKHFKSRLQLEIKPVQTAFHQQKAYNAPRLKNFISASLCCVGISIKL